MRFRPNAISLFALLAGSAVLLDGCGGGGAAPSSPITVPIGTKLTSDNVSSFSADAVTLTERSSTEPFLSAYDAAVLDADLARIRKRYPQVSGIHAGADYVDREMLVGVTPASSLIQQWFANGLPSTQGPLLDVLKTYGAQDEQYLSLDSFKVTFSGPINVLAVAKLMMAASPDIRYAEPNWYIGDGDNITYSASANTRTYAFSHGWGDCIAGCISRHTWTFVVGNGIVSFKESGPPIPPDGGRAVNARRGTTADALSSGNSRQGAAQQIR